MTYSKGDRFHWIHRRNLGVWEVIHKTPGSLSGEIYNMICIEGGDVGRIEDWWLTSDNGFEYIGNFNKSTNLTTLYEILCS